jgi:hypothetical protein
MASVFVKSYHRSCRPFVSFVKPENFCVKLYLLLRRIDILFDMSVFIQSAVAVVGDSEDPMVMLRGIEAGAADLVTFALKSQQFKMLWQHAVRKANSCDLTENASQLKAAVARELKALSQNDTLVDGGFLNAPLPPISPSSARNWTTQQLTKHAPARADLSTKTDSGDGSVFAPKLSLDEGHLLSSGSSHCFDMYFDSELPELPGNSIAQDARGLDPLAWSLEPACPVDTDDCEDIFLRLLEDDPFAPSSPKRVSEDSPDEAVAKRPKLAEGVVVPSQPAEGTHVWGVPSRLPPRWPPHAPPPPPSGALPPALGQPVIASSDGLRLVPPIHVAPKPPPTGKLPLLPISRSWPRILPAATSSPPSVVSVRPIRRVLPMHGHFLTSTTRQPPELVKAAIQDAIKNPQQRPPLGLRPPSFHAVLAELKSRGVHVDVSSTTSKA